MADPAEAARLAAARASGTLTIDLAAIIANWRQLRDRVAPAACAAVVKADAYGTGLAEAGAALASAGCETFFVAGPPGGGPLSRARPARALYILHKVAAPAGGPFFRQPPRPA